MLSGLCTGEESWIPLHPIQHDLHLPGLIEKSRFSEVTVSSTGKKLPPLLIKNGFEV